MIITDEILAAYVDGTLPLNQVEEVRQYLATHPQEMEQVIRIMDKNPIVMKRNLKQLASTISKGNTCSAASMTSPHICNTHYESKRKTNILQNLDSLFKEVF